MKNHLLILFFLLNFQLISAQSVLEQPITLEVNNVPFIEILKTISQQSNARFAYNKRRIPLRKKLSIQVTNVTLEKTLTQLLEGTGIQFSASKQQISLFRKIVPYHTISGYIRDAKSGEALVEANVFEAKYFRGVSSNGYGFYSLSLPEGRHLMKTTYIGYQELVDTIDLYGAIRQDIMLKSGNELQEIIIVGNSDINVSKESMLQQSVDNGVRINVEKAHSIPSILGQGDLLKAVQLLPGVISGGLNGNKLYIRGGDFDQNLILLDDVPLYNLNHLFGVVSILNGDIIHSAKTYLDAFPARYGGRLSSLVDIRTKEGHKQEFHGGLSLGWFIGTAYLEGPIQKGKSSFVLSSRRSWLSEVGIGDNIGFFDINAKVNFKLSSKDRLFISFYTGKDIINNRIVRDSLAPKVHNSSINLNWQNTAFSLRWSRILGKRLFVNTTLLRGLFDYNIHYSEVIDEFKKNTFDFRYHSFIEQYGLKTDFNYLPSINHHIRFGGSYRYLHNNPGSLKRNIVIQGDFKEYTDLSEMISSHESYIYGEDEFKINPSLTINAGIHLAVLKVQSKTWWSPQLRFLLTYAKNEKNNWSFSYSDMAQSIHLLNNSGLETGDSKWVSVTKLIGPSTSKQVSANYQSFFNAKWNFKISAYYKKMAHLRRFKLGATITNNIKNWEENVLEGIGQSFGLELLLAKTKGATQGWISYTLAKNRRRFKGLINNKFFPHQEDRRHTIHVTVSHQFKEKKRKQRQVNLVWSYASGQWITLPTRAYISQSGLFVPDFDVVNNYQLAPSHRLDISYNRKKITAKGFEHRWVFGVYNVYAKISPYSTSLDWNETSKEFELAGEYFTSLPIPFITYSFGF